jgi:hypothetical protein
MAEKTHVTKQRWRTPGEALLEAATQSRTSILLALRTAAIWGLSVFLWLVLLSIGWSTLTGRGALAEVFFHINVGPWFRYLVGTVELASAIALLIPRARFWGACAIAAVLLGATYANVAVMHAALLAEITVVLAIAAVLLMILAWSDARARRH